MRHVINLNDRVQVRLTAKGRDVLRTYYEKAAPRRDTGMESVIRKRLSAAPQDFQLQDLMMVFGEHLFVGQENLFVDNDLELL